jgi:hypothetical protein
MAPRRNDTEYESSPGPDPSDDEDEADEEEEEPSNDSNSRPSRKGRGDRMNQALAALRPSAAKKPNRNPRPKRCVYILMLTHSLFIYFIIHFILLFLFW